MKDLTELKKEYEEEYSELYAGCQECGADEVSTDVWQWITTNFTPKQSVSEEEKLVYVNKKEVEDFAKWFAGKYFSNIESSVEEYLSTLEQKGDNVRVKG
jgi:hypothetical protein